MAGDDQQTVVFPITPDDRIRVVTVTRSGQVAKLAVQLECKFRGRWVELRRYDTAHPETYGQLHVHSAPWSKKLDTRQAVVFHGSLEEVADRLVDAMITDWWDLRTAHDERIR